MEFTVHFFNAPAAAKADIEITVSVEHLSANSGWVMASETVQNVAFTPYVTAGTTVTLSGQWAHNLGKVVTGLPTDITFSFSQQYKTSANEKLNFRSILPVSNYHDMKDTTNWPTATAFPPAAANTITCDMSFTNKAT